MSSDGEYQQTSPPRDETLDQITGENEDTLDGQNASTTETPQSIPIPTTRFWMVYGRGDHFLKAPQILMVLVQVKFSSRRTRT